MTLNPVWISNELDAIDLLGGRPLEKGQRLEALISAIFSLVSGLEFDSADRLNFYRTEEIDLLFWNDRERDGVHFLDCPLIIECKSSNTPLAGRDLRYFATTLADKGRRSGILVALGGIAGNEESASAGFYHMTAALGGGVTILVVTREDLLALTTVLDLVALLKRRLLALTRSQILEAGGA